MAKLNIDFYACKIPMFYRMISHFRGRAAPGVHMFINVSKLRKKVNNRKIAESLGCDIYIPLYWIETDQLKGKILSVVFKDGIIFSFDDTKLYFRKDDEEAFVPVDLVQKVYESGNTRKVLWTDEK